jgi:iduronate 2-sulfatase
MLTALLYLYISALTFAVVESSPIHDSKKNVLFIIYDDLRPLFNAYGEKHMITPNFDRLASKSVIFDSAHCQVTGKLYLLASVIYF